MPRLAANLSLLYRLGYRGWIGCEYNPEGEPLEGLAWAKLYRAKA